MGVVEQARPEFEPLSNQLQLYSSESEENRISQVVVVLRNQTMFGSSCLGLNSPTPYTSTTTPGPVVSARHQQAGLTAVASQAGVTSPQELVPEITRRTAGRYAVNKERVP